MHAAKIPQVLVLALVVSAFATALAIPAGNPVDGASPVASTGKTVLIYGPSLGALVPPPWDYNEETIARALGHSVVVADAPAWLGLTAAEFAAFDAIIFGDPKCEVVGSPGTTLLEPANANKAVWSPAITGPTIITGTTPQFYQFNPNLEDRQLIANGIEFAASGPGTGLYASLSCYYLMAPSNTPVDFLSPIGDFRVGGREGCTDPVTIVDPTHPAMLGLTTLGQPDWGCASQELITSFPTSLGPLATAVRPSDGANLPFIVATAYETPNDPPLDPIVDPPVDLQFDAFWAVIEVDDDEVEVEGGFTLGAGSDGINPVDEDVTVEIGSYSFTIPAGSFDSDDDDDGEFEFEGTIDGVKVEMEIEHVGDNTFKFEFEIEGGNLDGLVGLAEVEISLAINDDFGETMATPDHDDEDDDADDANDQNDDEDDDEDDDDDGGENGDEDDADDEGHQDEDHGDSVS